MRSPTPWVEKSSKNCSRSWREEERCGSGEGKPKAGEGKDIRIEAFNVENNAVRLARMAEAVRSGKLAMPIVRKFRLGEAATAQKQAEDGHVDGKIVLVP